MKRSEKTILIMIAAVVVILLLGFYYGCREGGQEAAMRVEPPAGDAAVIRV